ncbi:hypothetical protein [Actinacidiphila glaucinigra]|uniref:Uncharacterized protein n=1 Tax=Actinacidiphila glaucinigra TaxID=235986 RepID=A0A239KW51_9ACTN|nr:hypothetical protein [Actinacidiphila glaucinigra]SNT22451.1 hypothetical protein SAMN05216252_11784 [Actinacidiphila glaucinigra]
MRHIARAVSAIGDARGPGHEGYALAPRCPLATACRATSADKWLVGFRVRAGGTGATWLYYVVDHANDAMDAKERAISMAGDEIDVPCPLGRDGVGSTEIRLIHDDGIGPRRLLPCP